MLAEDDHVGEVFFDYFFFSLSFCRYCGIGSGVLGQGFTEYAAGGENGKDCADHVGRGGEGEVAGVVLRDACQLYDFKLSRGKRRGRVVL